MTLYFRILALIAVCLPVGAFAKPLSDAVSASMTLDARPGLLEVVGQQNLSSRIGLQAGYQRERFLEDSYAGWQFGLNALLLRLLSEDWIAAAILSAGLSGMQGPAHDHSALWSKLDLDWETRHLLLEFSGEIQRGNRMPAIDATQLRLGYSPFLPSLHSLQPWLLASWISRSGTGDPQPFAILRILSGSWWLEIGTSLTSPDRFLGFSVSL